MTIIHDFDGYRCHVRRNKLPRWAFRLLLRQSSHVRRVLIGFDTYWQYTLPHFRFRIYEPL